MEKVGRNSPCPCGSGKKYKKCCGKRVDYNYNEIHVKLKEFISNSNYKYIYTTSTEIICSHNEDYYEDEGKEEFLELIEKIKKDSRFKISKTNSAYVTKLFYPYFEIMYLSSDCEQLNKDYISEEFKFNFNDEGIDLIEFEIKMKRENFTQEDEYEEYIKLAKSIDEFIGGIDWYSIDAEFLVDSLKNIGITEPFSD